MSEQPTATPSHTQTAFQTISLEHTSEAVESACSWLVQIHPLDLEQQRLELAGEVVIGRSGRSDIVLEDESVSRRHAVIRQSDQGFSIEDLGSTNGVVINDQEVEQAILRSGDRIQLGNRIFRYLADSDVESQYHETVYNMMTRDGLTSVFNKRYLLDCLDRELARARRRERRLAVVLMDIDHFKSINDTHGHLVGDEVLRELAFRLGNLMKGDEILARFGGEEFAIVNSEVELADATELAEACRRAIADEPFETSAGPLHISISLGVAAEIPQQGTTRDDLMELADHRLYRAKENGRNQVNCDACPDHRPV